MSQFTNYAENKLADMVRGQGLTLPTNWYIAAGSAADDGSFTEISGSGIARMVMARSLANWSGTQGAGTTVASSGSSHLTSNNIEITLGTASASIGTITHLGFFDASSSGNCWIWVELDAPIVTANGVEVAVPAGFMALTLGLSGGMSDYLANKLIDRLFRGQAYTFPSSMWLAAMTSATTNAGGGTEVGGGVGYARYEMESSLSFWSGTQGAGTTVASTGTSGAISNNAQIIFSPTGSWGDVGWVSMRDASAGGNLLFHGALNSPKSVSASLPLLFSAGGISITFA